MVTGSLSFSIKFLFHDYFFYFWQFFIKKEGGFYIFMHSSILNEGVKRTEMHFPDIEIKTLVKVKEVSQSAISKNEGLG